ncbi:MAG: DUF1566 domain-containing protein [Bacteriovoracaceae bacterium]|nr:DUF1566 domain-containing protein [Bacteriovoracaceae bacterium]
MYQEVLVLLHRLHFCIHKRLRSDADRSDERPVCKSYVDAAVATMGGFAPATLTTATAAASGDTTLTVASTTGYPAAGTLLVGSEVISYSGTTATTFTGLTRRAYGTTAAAITGGTTVNIYILLSRSTTTSTPKMVVTGSGNVGIGTATPVAPLQVAGEVVVGNTSISCTATTKGAIRYNNTSSVLEFCNGTAWNLIQAAACTDPTPNVISFADEANATASTLYTAATAQVTGINCSVPVTISGQGSPQYQICSDSGCSSVIQGWTSSPSSITNNQYIQTRLTADSVGGSNFQATIIVGSGASVWSVTTAGGDCTLSPTPGTVCADGTIYAGLSPDGNVKMFTTRCDAGQTWNGSSCTGSRSGLSWNNGTVNWFTTGVTGSTTGKANSNTLNGLVDVGAPYVAAQYCESLSENGKTDWYLPALTELNVLYTNKLSIKNFEVSGSVYWSSREAGDNSAWYQRFSVDNQNGNSKYSDCLVRCVRR